MCKISKLKGKTNFQIFLYFANRKIVNYGSQNLDDFPMHYPTSVNARLHRIFYQFLKNLITQMCACLILGQYYLYCKDDHRNG